MREIRKRRSEGGHHIGPQFTEKDRETALLIVEGLSNTEIAERLVLERRTVKGRTHRLYSFFQVPPMHRVKLAYAIRDYLELESIMGA